MSTTIKQMSLWDFFRELEEASRVQTNGLGPFEAGKEEDIWRYFSCNNYDACLTKASNHLWNSFSCAGCRKVVDRADRIKAC